MSFLRLIARHRPLVHPIRRAFSTTILRCDASRTPTHFTNILADGIPPPVQVTSITPTGILLADGLILPGACIFLEGKVFLWDVPEAGGNWNGWTKEHFEVFEAVVPKPEILLLGTGAKMSLPPQHLRKYMSDIGIQMDFMDTRNACSTYNLLAEEGRRVAAALLPLSPRAWRKPDVQ
ncbi:DUF498-domain-containing protein [Athelia psychrophila]|uniref:NADH dehydrogenase [ubiquinone] 1 alpha subcomplex assembly factor 3 n=1 Tax=Athelia psychrophila TaxID=1759441 RepID=A0A166K5I4_9AGAM|nr:DUF498-domain-containing protein [Fibularhizoctonia sp. CBS 109695]